MKKILVLAFLAALPSSLLWADDLTQELQVTPPPNVAAPTTQQAPSSESVTSEDQLGPHQRWIERVEGTLGIPASSDVTSAVNPGFGGGLAFGYRLDQHFSISAASGYYQYGLKNPPVTAASGFFSYVPLESVFAYNFGEGTFRPYVSIGVGFAFNTYTLGTTLQSHAYETSFFLSPAIGFLQVISPRAAIFVEGRMDMDFRANNTLGIADGTPSIFIPIQAGLTFFVI